LRGCGGRGREGGTTREVTYRPAFLFPHRKEKGGLRKERNHLIRLAFGKGEGRKRGKHPEGLQRKRKRGKTLRACSIISGPSPGRREKGEKEREKETLFSVAPS